MEKQNEFFNFDSPLVGIDKHSYNMAIDDFLEKLLEIAPRNYAGTLELGGMSCYLSANQVKKIAEQLKK